MSRMSYTNVPTSDTNHELQLETNLMGYPHQEDSAMIPKALTTDVTTIQVIAPATLPEGYEFDVTLPNQRTIKVTVPPGGIETGQTFPINVPNELLLSVSPTNASMNGGGSSPTISIPVGHWRDDTNDLFRYGIFHPHCLASCFCPLLAIGQVITRLQLRWNATQANTTAESARAFSIILTITIVHFSLWFVLYFTVLALDPNVKEEGHSYIIDPETMEIKPVYIQPGAFETFVVNVYTLMKWLYFVITGLWVYQVRKVVRHKYAIPGRDLHDCCCSFFCPCFISGQLLRHTTDYDVYPAYLCTSNGLNPNVAVIV